MSRLLYVLGACVLLCFCESQNLHANFQNEIEYCCPDNSEWGNFFVGGDWLYWKTEETKLTYAAAVNVSGESDLVISSTILKPKFQYESGYRIFGGYTTSDELWKFCAVFSHIPSQGKNSFIANPYYAFG